MDKNIQIIDIGLGNIASIQNMLKKIGVYSQRLTEPDNGDKEIDLLILPGVGSYDYAMNKLNSGGWAPFIKNLAAEKKTHIMGICLGMQLLCDGSEEGNLPGLSLIPGYFKKFNGSQAEVKLKVPHMGWNTVDYNKGGKWLMEGHSDSPRYYFVHSYYYTHNNSESISGTTDYGVRYASAIEKENVIGFQFHPEKSHQFGMNLFRNVINRLC